MPLQSNYGGIFQILALKDFLMNNGHEVMIINRRYEESFFKRILKGFFENNGLIDYKNIGFQKRITRPIERFIEQHLTALTKPIYSDTRLRNEMKAHNFDVVIVGSDQIWRPIYMKTIWRNAFLDFVDDKTTRKIAYAASFGKEQWEYPEKTEEITAFFKEFNAISVREDSGVAMCAANFDFDNAKHVVDPTLLIARTYYDQFIQKEILKGEGNGIFAYVLDDSAFYKDVLVNAQKQLEIPINLVNVGQPIEAYKKIDGYARSAPEDWLASFYRAKFVVTDSYHGTLFSIIFRKPFIAIANKKRGEARFTSLLGKLGLTDRLMYSGKPIDISLFKKEINYTAVYEILDPWIDFSSVFLLNSIDETN